MAGSAITFAPGEVSSYYTSRVPDLRQRGGGVGGDRAPSMAVTETVSALIRQQACSGVGLTAVAAATSSQLEMALTSVAWVDAVAKIERIVGRTLLDRPTNRVERRALAAACSVTGKGPSSGGWQPNAWRKSSLMNCQRPYPSGSADLINS
jgi:hypothetical protein